MGVKSLKEKGRFRKHKRIRKKVFGTTERLRLAVHRSLLNFYAQLIDDNAGKSILQVSTLDPEVKKKLTDGAKGGNIKGAEVLGKVLAERANAAGVTQIVFDRGGYLYHGRIKAFADSVRKHGLVF